MDFCHGLLWRLPRLRGLLNSVSALRVAVVPGRARLFACRPGGAVLLSVQGRLVADLSSDPRLRHRKSRAFAVGSAVRFGASFAAHSRSAPAARQNGISAVSSGGSVSGRGRAPAPCVLADSSSPCTSAPSARCSRTAPRTPSRPYRDSACTSRRRRGPATRIAAAVRPAEWGHGRRRRSGTVLAHTGTVSLSLPGCQLSRQPLSSGSPARGCVQRLCRNVVRRCGSARLLPAARRRGGAAASRVAPALSFAACTSRIL